MAPWSLVCPASRGIGFHLTRNLLRTTTSPIVATARKDVEETRRALLDGLEKDVDPDRLHVFKVDVTDEDSIATAAEQAGKLFPTADNHLRLAFCIPGVLHPEKAPAQLDLASMQATFNVNTLGPLLMIKHFSPFLPTRRTNLEPQSSSSSSSSTSLTSTLTNGLPSNHAIWLTMSARVGSTSDNNGLGGWYSYRASKAAVNSVTRTFDLWLRQKAADRALAIAYHPGTVRTGLSRDFWANVKEGKLFEPDFAVERMLDVVRGLKPEQRGRCWDWKGDEVLP